MPEINYKGLTVIYNSVAAGAPIAAGNTNIVTVPFTLATTKQGSIMIMTDGGAIIDYGIQVTNLPSVFMAGKDQVKIWNNQTTRDDAYNSGHWTRQASGSIQAQGGVTQNVMAMLNFTSHAFGRVQLAWNTGNTGGATGNVFVTVSLSGG